MKTKPLIIILGMHRSGTSCLAGSLQSSGINFGLVSKFNPHNHKGNRENLEVMNLNNEVLSFNNGSWNNPPEIIKWNSDLITKRDSLIEKYSLKRSICWAFKDPRTILTLEFWTHKVNNVKFVATFRNPYNVAESLSKRDSTSTTEGLDLWQHYNKKLLTLVLKYDIPVINFDWEKEKYIKAIDTITETLSAGQNLKKDYEFFDKNLIHQKNNKNRKNNKYWKLYNRLDNFTILRKPLLSIVVIFYNMQREAPRTLYSLSTTYQNKVHSSQYEVIAIDNSSQKPLDKVLVKSFGVNFSYEYFNTTSKSPCQAINKIISKVNSKNISIAIDGARILSPGIIYKTLKQLALNSNSFIYTLGMHLGTKAQNLSIEEGYNQEKEDLLLQKADWKKNGYKLFKVSSLALSSKKGFFSLISESNFFTLSKKNFIKLDGFNEKFTSPGGGLINLDFFNKVNSDSKIIPKILMGEATFHQFHGGVATNVKMENHPFNEMKKEYEEIYNSNFKSIYKKPFYTSKINRFIPSDLLLKNHYCRIILINKEFVDNPSGQLKSLQNKYSTLIKTSYINNEEISIKFPKIFTSLKISNCKKLSTTTCYRIITHLANTFSGENTWMIQYYKTGHNFTFWLNLTTILGVPGSNFYSLSKNNDHFFLENIDGVSEEVNTFIGATSNF